MKTNNILTIGLLITLGISLYNLNSINNLKGETEETDSNKTFIPPAPPIIQKDLNSAQKNMMNNPLTPQMNNNSGPTTLMAFNEDVHDFGTVDIETENKYSFILLGTSGCNKGTDSYFVVGKCKTSSFKIKLLSNT